MHGADTWGTTRTQIEEATEEDTGYFRNGKRRKNGNHGRFRFGTKPFIAWDGEGYSVSVVHPNGDIVRKHRYCLFGNSRDDYVTGHDLSTEQCLSLLLQSRQRHPGCANVSFSFDYDVNMILRDLPRWQVKRLKKEGWVTWHGYRIEHRPKKWFQVSAKFERDGSTVTVAIRVEDVFSFFSSSFVAALEKYCPENKDISTIRVGKDRRSQFGYHEMSFIREYWRMEQRAMVDLVETFRRTLYSADVTISSWYGPGAIATFFFKSRGVEGYLHRHDIPAVEMASRLAYAGGRFELLRCGHYNRPVYSYDLNSAYPYAIAQLPDMASGQWVHLQETDEIQKALQSFRLGYVHLDWHPPYPWAEQAVYNAMPMPLFHRSPLGNVSFPVRARNWYHLQEAAWVMAQDPAMWHVSEAWIFEDDGSYPFEWVADTYEQRLAWKRAGNPAELGLKLGLNSFYGKMAQRIGWDREKNLPPHWHQLDWAGWITSLCRSMLWIPMVEAYLSGSLISVETDGIFSTEPLSDLPNGLGDSLGQWKESVYEGMTAIQSGMYWLKEDGKWLQPKSRGIPKERLDHDRALRALRADFDRGIVKGSHNTFIGYGKALSSSSQWDQWRTWQESQREYAIGGDGKRVHDPGKCEQCANGVGYDEGLHNMRVGRIDGGDSTPHFLPWRSGDETDYHAEYDEERMWGVRV